MAKGNVSPTPKSTKVHSMPFPEAIKAVMGGKKIQRLEWPKEEYGVLENSFLSIFRNGKIHIWQVSEGDLLGIDWVVVK